MAWNSFVLRALAEAGTVLGRPDYLEAARTNADFLLGSLRRGGRLLRSWKGVPGRVEGFLEDYAGLGNALLTLYEATLEARWLEEARGLAETVVSLFWEEDDGRFYDGPADGEALVVRPRDVMDNATPSGNSLAVELLLRTGHLFGEERHWEVASRVLEKERGAMEAYPTAFGHLLSALDRQESAPLEVTLLGTPGESDLRALLREAWRPYLPNRVVPGGDPEILPPLPLLEGREAREGRATAYVCRAMTCSAPILDPEGLREEMEKG